MLLANSSSPQRSTSEEGFYVQVSTTMKILNILITFANHDENVEYFANDDQPTTRAGKWNPTCTTPQDIFR